jgi:NADPH2:quinone reductase
LPAGWDFAQAAALPETAFTVWTNLFEDGALRAGETALIHGGSGGIGIMAIEMARAFGARAIATVGRPGAAEFCRERGADSVILHKEEDFVARTREATEGRGADVVLDVVGGPYLARNLEALAPGGRLIQIAVMGGAKAEIDLFLMMRKRLRLAGSTLRSRPVEEKSRIARELERRVWPLLAAGRIRPQVTRTFPLERAAEAHALMEAGGHLGKLALVVD